MTAPVQLSPFEVTEFDALTRYASMLRAEMESLVIQMSHITGEEPDEDFSLGSSVAWDVIHNGIELKDVLRRCNLSLPDGAQA